MESYEDASCLGVFLHTSHEMAEGNWRQIPGTLGQRTAERRPISKFAVVDLREEFLLFFFSTDRERYLRFFFFRASVEPQRGVDGGMNECVVDECASRMFLNSLRVSESPIDDGNERN